MSKESHDKLLSYVHLEPQTKEVMAKPRGGAVIPVLCLCFTLRWLAGGSHLDICDIAGISKALFCRLV